MFGAAQTMLRRASSVQAEQFTMIIPNPADYPAAKNAYRGTLETRSLHIECKVNQGDLRAIGRAQHFVRDQENCGHGGDVDHLFKVQAGVVRTYKFLREGRRQVDAFHGPGNVFG
jgi:CRP-like cAMP-binding protein